MDTRLYPTYLDNNWSPQELERLIEKILEKIAKQFNADTQIYDDFMYHRYLTGILTSSIDPTAFILDRVGKTASSGLDGARWHDLLITRYSDVGQHDKAIELLKTKYTKLLAKKDAFEKGRTELTGVPNLTIYGPLCDTANDLRVQKTRTWVKNKF